ncbi:hypothetical protein D3C77_639730 [compost metagenome]
MVARSDSVLALQLNLVDQLQGLSHWQLCTETGLSSSDISQSLVVCMLMCFGQARHDPIGLAFQGGLGDLDVIAAAAGNFESVD